MAFKIVNGKLVKITSQAEFGTPAQRKAGRRITGTLGLPQTRQQAARQLSKTFAPPPPAAQPSAPITLGRGPIRETDFGPRAQEGFQQGTLSAPTTTPLVRLTGGDSTRAPAFDPRQLQRGRGTNRAEDSFFTRLQANPAQALGIPPLFGIPGAIAAGQERLRQQDPSAFQPVQPRVNASALTQPTIDISPETLGRKPTLGEFLSARQQSMERQDALSVIREQLQGFGQQAVSPAQASARPAVTGTVGGGNTLDQQLLNLAATDPERLRERARFINMSQDRGAQIDVGVALTAESMARGRFPDVMTDAVAGRLATLYGYGSLEEMMADLGYLPNPDAPGTWLRREPTAPGTFGTSGFGGDGGGRATGRGRGTFVRGAVPRATRGRGFSLGLTNWRI